MNRGQLETTVGEEKKYNPRLTKDIDSFIQLMDNLNLPKPKMIGKYILNSDLVVYHWFFCVCPVVLSLLPFRSSKKVLKECLGNDFSAKKKGKKENRKKTKRKRENNPRIAVKVITCF